MTLSEEKLKLMFAEVGGKEVIDDAYLERGDFWPQIIAYAHAVAKDAIPDGFMLVEKQKLAITLLESYTMLMRGLGTQLELLSEIEALKKAREESEWTKNDTNGT